MIVELRRTSGDWDTSPDERAFRETRYVTHEYTFKTIQEAKEASESPGAIKFFREGGINHRELEDGIAVDRPDEVWLMDIPSIEWATKEWGELVVRASNVVGIDLYVEIYDDWRE